MASIVGGAALGAAFEILFKTVLDATVKTINFNSDLSRLKSTLFSIKPAIEDIQKFNRILDRPPHETEMFTDQLKNGEKLVRKCSKVKWNVCKRLYYSRKLSKLENLLVRFFHIEVAALHFRESKKISVGVSDLEEKVNEMVVMMKSSRIGGGDLRGFTGWCSVPGVPEYVVGLEEPLREVRGLLLGDGGDVVVLSAPGGCGKTTLAKKICHDEQIKGVFGNNIFFVTVSRSPNLNVIVQRIFRNIDIHQVPDFQGDEDPIYQLEHLFSRHIGQNPILLVLDDVWSGPSGEESLIEKFIFKRPRYKILVTSRSVLPRFNTYRLNLLSNQEALQLFNHSAFKDGICSVSNDLVDKVVKACGGFPLALKAVGGSLYGKPEPIWISRFSQSSSSQSIFNMSNDLFCCLKSSLDTLDELPILKECYLDLGSFSEDQKIPISTLLDMWVELYNLDEEGAYTFAYLYELFTRNLLDLVLDRTEALNDVDYINERFAMQHDLLRELAIHLNGKEPIEYRRRVLLELKGNDFPKWWTEKRQQPIQAQILSISTDETFVSNWDDAEFPGVKVLILNFQSMVYTLPHFMDKMWNLKVLIVTNNGSCPTKLGEFPSPDHLLNLKRLRLEHISISSIASSILHLRNLRKISLVMCNIGDSFENCELNIHNIWPNVTEIVIDYCDDLVKLPLWLCSLVQLKKLTISHCPDLMALPEELGNLTNLEILRIQSCTTLTNLPESIERLHKLRFLDLSDCVGIEHLPEEMSGLRSLRKIDMRGCGELSELPCSVLELVQLEHVICDEENEYLWGYHTGGWSNLKLTVESLV
ncbi:hypothetical protein RD792_004122 [Penstemon davidsonii]|uniref:RPW8 domain-containing protein n=1 Tax=Penstemon davidsonii TaxID=160366 RepID=A0ABR0DGL8_9LAMI|nr:hypothetical protein RD792_004122 [Penstemon davidsonii]